LVFDDERYQSAEIMTITIKGVNRPEEEIIRCVTAGGGRESTTDSHRRRAAFEQGSTGQA
jgi:hypothetical protein